jgi:hypothetical protein
MPERATLAGSCSCSSRASPGACWSQEMGCGSGMTCWRRLKEWYALGEWKCLHQNTARSTRTSGENGWSQASLESAAVPAAEGGEKTSPNPTDRGKQGSKRHLVVDKGGVSLAVSTLQTTYTTRRC